MRRPVALAVAVLAAAFAAAAHAATDIPIDQVSLPVPRGKEVRFDFPVGELRVEATSGSRISVDLTARCKSLRTSRCEDYAERITIETDDSAGELRVKVKGYPKVHSGGFNLRGVLRVPRDVALRIEMGVGELRVADLEGDLDVDLGVGDAEIRTPRATVRSVDVSTGVGDADVYADGSRVKKRGFISSSASWDEGRGRSTVNLHVGVGDATVRVD